MDVLQHKVWLPMPMHTLTISGSTAGLVSMDVGHLRANCPSNVLWRQVSYVSPIEHQGIMGCYVLKLREETRGRN